MPNIADYVSQLQTLTNRNLEILQAINNSFFTKREHLQVVIGDAEYVIPSFIALENKINILQENFDNLVYAPKTGEAIFNTNGNSKHLELRGYTCTPERISLQPNTKFNVEQNSVFKDLLTPNPYIRFDLKSIDNDITTVNVRKIIPQNTDLINRLVSLTNSGSSSKIEWSEVSKILFDYKKNIDYISYDTTRSLPIRTNSCSGTYTIKTIKDDKVDGELNETIKLTIFEDLKYKLFDETIEKYLEIGDELVTFDDSAKMEIIDVNSAASTITVKVLNGDYLNLGEAESIESANSTCKLKFFNKVDYAADKYINIPLEEDKYILVFIAPLNSRLNVQAPWGTGVWIDTDSLSLETDNNIKFKDYYNENVKNIGDILYEITNMASSNVLKYGEEEFRSFTEYKPIIDRNNLEVIQINDHINNSTDAKNIKDLHNQKYLFQDQLKGVQNDIKSKINELTNSSLTVNQRSNITNSLNELSNKQNSLLTSISSIISEIENAKNNNPILAESPKYRIRGYYKWANPGDVILNEYADHIHGIKVQYRYKGKDSTTGSATSIDEFIFSDWNDMPSFILNKIAVYESGYKFKYPTYTDNVKMSHDNGRLNEPSFNQIDIPISPGETVDIRLKIIWDFGYPFVETTSDWSDIINIGFPEEYLNTLQLSDIIKINNDDYEKDKFRNILEQNGAIQHVSDGFMDQDVQYYHKPQQIASGFYTNERRVIPLDEKLREINKAVIELNDLIEGTSSSNIQVSLILDGNSTKLEELQGNNIILPCYENANTTDTTEDKVGVVVKNAVIEIKNTSQSHTAYIYSMFPSATTDILEKVVYSQFDTNNYTIEGSNEDNSLGIYIGTYTLGNNRQKVLTGIKQKSNQWITFRSKLIQNDEPLYDDVNLQNLNDIMRSQYNPNKLLQQCFDKFGSKAGGSTDGMLVCPYVSDESKILIPEQGVFGKISLGPGESLQQQVIILYCFSSENAFDRWEKTLSFDIRTNLYTDPKNYTINFIADRYQTLIEKSYSRAYAINQNN